MASIKGTFRQFTFAELEEYGGVNKLFYKLLMDVYAENKKMIPLDMLAYIMDVMSYERFIRAYALKNNAKDLEYGAADKLMDLKIMDYKGFSSNMLDQMITYNTIPYQITDHEFIFLTPEVNLQKVDNKEFVLYRRTITNVLGESNKPERIKRGSNKLFSDCLAILRGESPVTEDDILITDEEKLNRILIEGVVKKASDVYIDTKKDGVDVSFSIFNDMLHFRRYRMDKTKRNNLVNAVFKLAGMAPAKLEWPSGIKDFSIKNLGDIENGRYEGRVNVVNTINHPSPVIRIHDTRRTSKTLDDLPFHEKQVQELKKIISNRSGIIVIGGAKGQGKSTTIYACLDTIRKERPYSRIEEMSNPVEVQLDGISQLSLNPDIKVGYDELKSASTRRNASVNYIGEINNPETTDFVVNVAGQECLVLTTIHSESVSMIPMKVQGLVMEQPGLYVQFVELLKGMCHQVMLKRACPDCTEVVPTSTLRPEYKDILAAYGYMEKQILIENRDKLVQQKCETCGGNGFLIDKPVVCLDVLMVDDEMKDLIRESINNPRKVIEHEAMRRKKTGIHDALVHLSEGHVTFDMIYRGYQLQNMRESDRIRHRAE